MDDLTVVMASGLFFVIATLYSTIGHAGASGYLAIMTLLSFAPATIKPTSLVLNIVVSLIASVQFIRAGRFDRQVFWATILPSLPLAFVGGALEVDPNLFKLVAGVFLVLSAAMLPLRAVLVPRDEALRPLNLPAAIALGAVIGFFSGLIGVGGGIFLTPLIVMLRWTSVQNASGVSALFIFCNSVMGLLGNAKGLGALDAGIGAWIVAVVLGGAIGSYLGTRKMQRTAILVCLFVVLLSAGLKFIFMDFKP